MKSIFQKCAVGVGIAVMFATATLSAASFRSENVSIPFAFHVSKVALPAGEYRLEQSLGSDITFLVNLKTGQRVQFLRSNGRGYDGRAKLVFETTNDGYKLKTIS